MAGQPGSSRQNLVVLCIASAAWAFSFGIGAPLAALWLKDSGLDNKLTGLNTSIYYLGIALAAPFVPGLMRRWGRRCLVAGMVVDSLAVALFPWVAGPVAWFILRLACGLATALCLIPMETRVNRNAPPERRAGHFGVYAFSVALGVGLGPLIGLPLYRHAPHLAFALGGAVTLAGAWLIVWKLPDEDRAIEDDAGDRNPPIGENLFSLGTAWAQGFLEGAMVTFLSVYLLAIGYDATGTSGLMGMLFLGIILFQIPLAWLADRFGRLRLTLACHALVLIGLAGLTYCTGPIGLGAWLFLVGACSAALYPLGLALLGERVPCADMARANAWFLASNCAGSLTGPVLVGLAMDLYGDRAMFAAGAAAILLALAVGALPRLGWPAVRRWRRLWRTGRPREYNRKDAPPSPTGSAAPWHLRSDTCPSCKTGTATPPAPAARSTSSR